MAATTDSALSGTSATDGKNIEDKATGIAAGTQTANTEGAHDGAGEKAGGAQFSQADIDRIVKQRVKQAQEAAKAAADEEAAKKAGEYEKLYASESEKAKTLQAQLKATALKYEVAVIAARLNIQKTDIALKLIDMDAVEYDTEGKPTNIEALLQAVIKELPSLQALPQAGEDANKGKTLSLSTGGSINTQRNDSTALSNANYQPVGIANNPGLFAAPTKR